MEKRHDVLVWRNGLTLPITRIKDKLITTGRSSISLFNKPCSLDVPSIPPRMFWKWGGKKRKTLTGPKQFLTHHSYKSDIFPCPSPFIISVVIKTTDRVAKCHVVIKLWWDRSKTHRRNLKTLSFLLVPLLRYPLPPLHEVCERLLDPPV